MDELKARLERHRFHIRKLETLLRMLDNMSVEVSQVITFCKITSEVFLIIFAISDTKDKRQC
jgi:hypothetical protein